MSSQDYRIETGLVVNGPISADNVPGALSDLTDVNLGPTGPSNGDTLLWSSDTSKWEPGVGSDASYWTFQEGESPTSDLIYTQYNVGIGTLGDQSSDYRFVVNGGAQLDNLKVVSNSLIGDGLNEILGEINLVPNESLTLQGQYVRIRPTINADQSHIHIEAGNVDYADLFLGNDDRYVKIDRLGPVSIGVPATTTTSNWTAPESGNTANLIIPLSSYPWAANLTIGDFITLPDTTIVYIENIWINEVNTYVVLASTITYATSDVIEFTYQPRSIWSFNPDSSADFPGDINATSFIGDGSELTGIELAGLADVDTTTVTPSTGQGLLWDGLTSKWRPGNVGGGGGGGSLSSTTLSYTTASLAAGASANITLAGGNVFNLLAITSSTPAWVRVYGTTTARDADIRTQPGGSPPGSGNDYYAELVTVGTPQTIRFSPVPIVQGTAGNAYVRVKNLDSSAQAITIDFTILTLES